MGLPFRVFSINGQGTMVQVHVVRMSVGRGYRSLHGSTSYQLDLVSYMGRTQIFVLVLSPQDHGAGMHVGHVYGLMSSQGRQSCSGTQPYFITLLEHGTMHGVSVGPATCSNWRVYVDHTFIRGCMPSVLCHGTRHKTSLSCSPSFRRGPRYECMWYVRVQFVHVEHCMGLLVMSSIGYHILVGIIIFVLVFSPYGPWCGT